jgi:FtsH-binding integral membrane protein
MSAVIGITYLHLLGALGLTAVSSVNPISDSIIAYIIEIVLLFVLLFAMLAIPPSPLKYVLFAAFAITIGQLLTRFVAQLNTKNVLKDVLVTVAGIFLAMTALGFYDNQNILGFGSYLLAALFGLIVARLFLIVGAVGGASAESVSAGSNILSFLGAALFSVYVAYDTQRLKEFARGRGRGRGGSSSKGSPDYVDASLGLFLDAINLFESVGDIMD